MVIRDNVLKLVELCDLPRMNDEGKLVIPEGVTEIGDDAITIPQVRSWLNSVVIPDSVKVIGARAFCECVNLKEVDFGHGVEVIKYAAFYFCPKLSSIVLPDSLTEIGDNAFRSTGITSLVIPDSVKEVGIGVFSWNRSLTSAVVGKNLIRIASGMFSSCFNLTSITFKGEVTSIGQDVFYDCANLSDIVLPDSLVDFGYGALDITPWTSVRKNYKAFWTTPNGSLLCRKKRYAVGKKSMVRGDLSLCRNGIHYCTNLFEIFNYYYGVYGKDFVICECAVSDEQKRDKECSKRCARWIIPQRILTHEEVIKILNDGIQKKKKKN